MYGVKCEFFAISNANCNVVGFVNSPVSAYTNWKEFALAREEEGSSLRRFRSTSLVVRACSCAPNVFSSSNRCRSIIAAKGVALCDLSKKPSCACRFI